MTGPVIIKERSPSILTQLRAYIVIPGGHDDSNRGGSRRESSGAYIYFVSSSFTFITPPPAYTPPPNAVDYGSTSTSSSGASVLQYPDDVPLRRDRFPRGENARKRFIKAFLLALAHFALIAFIARRLSGVLMNVDWTKKDNNAITSSVCIEGGDRESTTQQQRIGDPYISRFSFKVPSLASELFFYSNDSTSSGNLVFDILSQDHFQSQPLSQPQTQYSASPPTTDIIVDIQITYRSQGALQRSKVCYITKKNSASHFVFMSTDPDTKLLGDSSLFLKYDVRVYLPPGTKNVPRVYNKLRVEMPLFQIAFIDTEPVRFSEVDLKAENAPVMSTALNAQSISVKTKNSEIGGTYAAENKLELITENAPIKVLGKLLNRPGSSEATELKIQTSNAALQALLELSSSESSTHLQPNSDSANTDVDTNSNINTNAEPETGGSFLIDARTSNNNLDVRIKQQPLSSSLHLNGRTSNAPVRVYLPVTYEGQFMVRTNFLDPHVVIAEKRVEDPAGLGRWRDVDVRKEMDWIIEGSVAWVDARVKSGGGGGRDRGYVSVQTNLAPATLYL
ncbi:hypothetical protein PNOK_0135300 [Pyrrhoderma noxium]|uniref:DUF7330 domain-containing protein n=1 Tax=Pyrrhoderma noxium TaxID=2282107 RepID=A0A286UXU0_9AGAM|nr:hypothetical protein PNOK_0135300 [Pyrrhoderma noxium]